MPVLRLIRPALALVALLGLSVPAASAAPRMLMGFQDDPSFRWGGDAQSMLDRAEATGVSVIRTTADWRVIAPTRPAKPADSFDPAYNFGDLDDMVRGAQKRGIEVLITIWGTPKWANGGQTPNVAPRNVNDLRSFAQALADRYSGGHAGYPYVGRWSVWNEPNLDLFLKPQYDAKGRIVGPRTYAKLYKAAYAGIKAGNARALVAIGETSARGRDRKSAGSGSVSPGKFAELVAQADRSLRFDAWAQHPYPTEPWMKPLQKVKWPNVTLLSLARFETSLDKWFGRRGIPIWITEYGHETKPAEPKGVSPAQQAAYTRQAILFAQKDPRVQMFVWFILRDSPTSTWQSGFYSRTDGAKPALSTWTSLVALTDGVTLKVKAGRQPTVKVELPRIAFYSQPGSTVGLTYRLYDGKKLVAVSQPAPPLAADGTISFPVAYSPAKGKTYTLTVDANDANGNIEQATLALTAT
jgi:aryl-phospho-beta-D-glucosidase BglC (GH1 family)